MESNSRIKERAMLSKSTLNELETRCPEAAWVRAVLENALSPEMVDRVFADVSRRSKPATDRRMKTSQLE
jgi:hypothetical protein